MQSKLVVAALALCVGLIAGSATQAKAGVFDCGGPPLQFCWGDGPCTGTCYNFDCPSDICGNDQSLSLRCSICVH